MEEAEDIVKIMMQRNVCPDIVTYTSLIDGYCMKGQMDKARKVFDSIDDGGIKPNIISYNSMINGYCKKGMVDEAWRLFSEIHGKGLECTTVTYTTIIQGLFRKGRFDDGWKLFKDMQVERVIPDLQTYNVLLDGLCRNKQIAEAFSFMRIMEDRGVYPDIVTYNTLIEGLCKNGKRDIARNLFNSLPSKGLHPDVVTYAIIVGSLCQEGMVEEAKSLLIEMENHSCDPNGVTYNVIIQGLLRRNELHKAVPFLEEMAKREFLADATTAAMLIDQLHQEAGGPNEGLSSSNTVGNPSPVVPPVIPNIGNSTVVGRSGTCHRSSRSCTRPVNVSSDGAAFNSIPPEQSNSQLFMSQVQSEVATSLAAAAAAELPRIVKLRMWSHDVKNPGAPLDAGRCCLGIPHAVLCSEMGAHFHHVEDFLAVCVACILPNIEADPGLQGQVQLNVTGASTSPTRHPISAHQVMSGLRIYSLKEATFGTVLASRVIRAARCLTLIQIYRVSDMKLVRVLPSAEDEVNVACFHPSVGGGFVYGTTEGKLRILQCNISHGFSNEGSCGPDDNMFESDVELHIN